VLDNIDAVPAVLSTTVTVSEIVHELPSVTVTV